MSRFGVGPPLPGVSNEVYILYRPSVGKCNLTIWSASHHQNFRFVGFEDVLFGSQPKPSFAAVDVGKGDAHQATSK